jgi:hypothetical protein
MQTHWRDTRKGSYRFWAIETEFQKSEDREFATCRQIIGITDTDTAILSHTCIWNRRELRPLSVGEWEGLKAGRYRDGEYDPAK